MRKKYIYLALIITLAICLFWGFSKVKISFSYDSDNPQKLLYTEIIGKDDIPYSTYIIGKYMFTRDLNDSTGYAGNLTTNAIMMASATIGNPQMSNMIIYYKNAKGNWVDALTNDLVDAPASFEIVNKNLEPLSLPGFIGQEVFLDVKTGEPCSNYHPDNSIDGYNGSDIRKVTENQNSCLKFYILSTEGSSKVNLILDHNTTHEAYYTLDPSILDNSSVFILNPYSEFDSLFNEITYRDSFWSLREDTKDWSWTETPTSYTDNIFGYTINYENLGLNSRLITKQEVLNTIPQTTKDSNNFFEEYYSSMLIGQSQAISSVMDDFNLSSMPIPSKFINKDGQLDYDAYYAAANEFAIAQGNFSNYINTEAGISDLINRMNSYNNSWIMSSFLYDNLSDSNSLMTPINGGYWTASMGLRGVNYVNYSGYLYQDLHYADAKYTSEKYDMYNLMLDTVKAALNGNVTREQVENFIMGLYGENNLDMLDSLLVEVNTSISDIYNEIVIENANFTYDSDLEVVNSLYENLRLAMMEKEILILIQHMLDNELTSEDYSRLLILENDLLISTVTNRDMFNSGYKYETATGFPIGIRPVITVLTSKIM